MSTSLPQLDPETARNLAITLGTMPRQIQPPGPQMAAPGPGPALPSSQPDLSVFPATAPNLKAPRGTLQGDINYRGEQLSKGAGEDQIYGRVLGSKLGEAHPMLGKILGGLGEGVAKLGDIGLSAVAPALAINLPGTEYHHAALVNQNNRQIGAEEQEATQETARQGEQARAAQEGAATGLTEEQTKELPGKTASEEGLQGAQTNEAVARTGAIENPQATTPELGTYRSLVQMGMSPSEALQEIEKDKQLAVKPANMQAKTLDVPGQGQVAGKVDSQGNLLLADGTPAPKGTKLYQAPNYGQLILPTKTSTFIDPKTSLPVEMQWNPATQTYDKPLGLSASNAYGHEVAQAGAVNRAGNQLVGELRDPANRQILGQLDSYIKQGTLGTPLADQRAAYLSAQLRTFAALQPAMHGFRSHSAQEAFQQIVGGLAQNPDATIGAIDGILKTAGSINPGIGGGNTGKGVSLKAAMGLSINKGKSEAEVRKDIETHGHTVVP